MKHSEALVATPNGAEYIRDLCSHWSRIFPVRFDTTTGQVTLPNTIFKLVAAPSTMLVQLEVQEDVDPQQMENIVEDQLRRFARGEVIDLKWRRR